MPNYTQQKFCLEVRPLTRGGHGFLPNPSLLRTALATNQQCQMQTLNGFQILLYNIQIIYYRTKAVSKNTSWCHWWTVSL